MALTGFTVFCWNFLRLLKECISRVGLSCLSAQVQGGRK